MAANYVTDESGTYIPATQRPDGTWRKARRVKDGYVPQEEVPLYESKGRQWMKGMPTLPPGLSLDDALSSPTLSKSAKKNARRKEKKKEAVAALAKSLEEMELSNKKLQNSLKNITKEQQNPKTTAQQNSNKSQKNISESSDPNKRLKSLRKKLRAIDNLQQKINSGEIIKPDKEQSEKISRKSEILKEIEQLEGKVRK